MRGKILLVFLSLLIIVSVSAQEQINIIDVRTEVKGIIDDVEPMVYSQVATGDKPGVQILTCYAMDVEEDQWQMIKLSRNPTIYWVIEYTAVFNTDVSFLYVWSGPQFSSFQTSWYKAKYKNYYQI